MKKTILIIMSILLLASPALAKEASVDTSTGRSVGREGSMALKNFYDERTNVSTRKSDTNSIGGESISGSMSRTAGSVTQGSDLSIGIPAAYLFIDYLAEMEEQDKSGNACKPITQPLYAGDLGVGAEVAEGLFDVGYADMLGKAAQSGSLIRTVGGDDAVIRAYAACLAWYGATVGQAQLLLAGDLKTLGATGGKGKKAKGGTVDVQGLDIDEFQTLAKAALIQVAQEGVTNSMLQGLYKRVLSERSPCRFVGGQGTTIRCGSITLDIAQQSLSIGDMPFYGKGTFGGSSATYRLSRAAAMTSSHESYSGGSTVKRWNSETNTTVDKLVSQGKGVDAVKSMKTATSRGSSGKQNASPSQAPQH